jgi:hypothetical protein
MSAKEQKPGSSPWLRQQRAGFDSCLAAAQPNATSANTQPNLTVR